MKKKLINSQLANFSTYQMYKRQLLTLAENVFEFENLPEMIDIGYLNSSLLRKGAVAFFKDEELDEVLALPFTNIGKVDLYGRPTTIRVYGRNGYQRTLKPDEYVIMYDNNGRYSLYIDILQYSERMALNKRVIDVNVSQQKTPRIWLTKNDKVKSLTDLLNEYDGNVETIAGYDNINLDEITSVISPAPYVADKIDMHLDKEWNEFLRLIGVANLTEQKRERVIKDEVMASQGGTIASRYARFEPRRRAVEQINKKWGLDMKVKYYDGTPTSDKSEEVEYDISMFNETDGIGL